MERLPGDPENVFRTSWNVAHTVAVQGDHSEANEHQALSPKTVARKMRPITDILRYMNRIYQSLFDFPDHCRGWIAPGVLQGLDLHRRYAFDLIYSSAAGPGISAHFIASRLQRYLGIPWVHEYRDLWSGNPWLNDNTFWWREQRERLWERRFLKQADGAVVMTPSNAKILAAKGPILSGAQIMVVPNGFDPADFDGDMTSPAGFPLQLCFTGSLYGGKRDISGLFAAIRGLIDRAVATPDMIRFAYAGDSSAMVDKLARQFGIESCVVIHGVISGPAARQLQQASHVLVLVEAADDNLWVMGNMPAKAYEYLGAARPVLVMAHPQGAIASLFEETQAGKIFHPSDGKAISGQISQWLEALRIAGRLDYAPDRTVIARQSWDHRVVQLADCLNHVIKEHTSRRND